MSTLIGIVGGSAAGKTLLARELAALLGPDTPILSQDNYYTDIGPVEPEERLKFNFDRPEAFDESLFVTDLKRLRTGQPVRVPVYEFATCHRIGYGEPREFGRYVVVEGLFLLTVPRIRALLDHTFFVDAPEEVRVQRILRRDVKERGRSHEEAWANIQNCVLPMHRRYIEPFKGFAESIVLNDRDDASALRNSAKAIAATVRTA